MRATKKSAHTNRTPRLYKIHQMQKNVAGRTDTCMPLHSAPARTDVSARGARRAEKSLGPAATLFARSIYFCDLCIVFPGIWMTSPSSEWCDNEINTVADFCKIVCGSQILLCGSN